jgi:uncharacterized membrane protein HdeD (DUF308 family)
LKLKTFVFRIVIGLLLVTLGILAFVQNQGFIRVLIIICGVYMICDSLFGVFTVSAYKPLFDESRTAKTLNLVSNIIGIMFGLFAVIAPFAWAKSVGLVLALLLAFYLLFSCFVAFRIYFGLKKAKSEIIPKNLLIEGLCDLIFALVLIIAPQQIASTIFVILGIVLIAAGAVTIALTISYKIRERKFHADDSEFQSMN